MKKITLELKRKLVTEEYENHIVEVIEKNFKLIDDSKDKHENLRFVTIDGEDINIDLNGNIITLVVISNPDIHFAIYKKFLYAVEVELWQSMNSEINAKNI